MYLSFETKREFRTSLAPLLTRLLPKGAEVIVLVVHGGDASLMSTLPPQDIASSFEAGAKEIRDGLLLHAIVSTPMKSD